jgi:hypothetical protein
LSKFYRLAYFTSEEEPMIHQLRDGDSFIEIMTAIKQKKSEIDYGNIIINYDPKGFPHNEECYWKEKFNKKDLLVQTSRPALDKDIGYKRFSINTNWLEEQIRQRLRLFFSVCTRKEIHLTDYIKKNIPKDSPWLHREFSVRPPYAIDGMKLKSVDDKPEFLTGAYFIYTPEIWKDGPDLLCTFGICGEQNLSWSYLFRLKFSYLLDNYCFAIIAMRFPEKNIPEEVYDLSFSDSWDPKPAFEPVLL